jgi:phage-related protein
MAGQSRTLKLSILADIDNLKKNLTSGSQEVQSFGTKLGDFSKKAGLAFAAAGAAAAVYAGKLAVDGVKAAIEDQAAQEKLATTLRNVTGATNAQITSVEDYIKKTSLAFGVTDDQLRPSLERLSRATGDVEKAQKLQTLAIDIAAGSGKSLETVSNALAKAQEGNTTALGKLGVGLSAAQLKTMSMDEITKKLGETFADQATVKAETFAGKMDRLKIAFDEGKETIGGFVLNAITPLMTAFTDKVIPTIQSAADKISKELAPVLTTLGTFFNETLIPAFKAFYNFINEYVIPILNVTLVPIIKAVFSAFNDISTALKNNATDLQPLTNALTTLAGFLRDTIAPIMGSFISGTITGIANVITGLINVAANVTSAVTTGFNAIKTIFTNVKDFLVLQASTIFEPLYDGMKAVLNAIIGIWNKLDFAIDISVPDWVPIVGGKGFKVADIFPDVPKLATGGIVNSPTLAMIGEAGPEAVVPLSKSGMMGNTINLTVNGAIDPESTARQIITLLNNSSYRGTLGAGALVS